MWCWPRHTLLPLRCHRLVKTVLWVLWQVARFHRPCRIAGQNIQHCGAKRNTGGVYRGQIFAFYLAKGRAKVARTIK